jgi:hypothetical protein
MNNVKIISFFIMIVIILVGCISNDNDNRKNSKEIKIELIDDIFHDDDFLLNQRYQVNLNFSNLDIDMINLSLDDFKLITKSKQYIADKSPNIPEHINKSETKNFVVSFDVDEDEKYENFKKVVYESKDLDLYYEFQVPR